MAAVLKKDYYQFCYDENEIVSSNENSFDGEEEEEEEVEEEDHHQTVEENEESSQDITSDCVENNECFFDTDPFDEFEGSENINPIFYTDGDSEVSSPTSVESFKLDGYVIEIDEGSNTININTSPQHSTASSSIEHLRIPCDDELFSSGISLDSASPVSSAHSLSTEIDRLRNIYNFNGFSSLRRNRRRKNEGSGMLVGKSAKSLESLKSRASTPDRKSPVSFFRNKTKSEIELNRYNKSNKTKKTKETSMFRLKRSSSMSLKSKRKSSKQRNSMDLLTHPRSSEILHQSSSTELTLQQPSPFVRTIFQFVETDFDDMFPVSSCEDLTSIPVYSCSRSKIFQDFTKNNSLSRRHKNRNNLSQIVRTVLQDNHEPIFLSSSRRVCETADFIIAVIAYLDRIRKAQEIIEETSAIQPAQQTRRHTIESLNVPSTDLEIDKQSGQSNRFQRLSSRKNYLLPLSLHERFSSLSDDAVFNEDSIITELFPNQLTRSSSSLALEKDHLLTSNMLNRSKSLKNISFGSLRRKSKQKQNDKDSVSAEKIPQTPHNKNISSHERRKTLSTEHENISNSPAITSTVYKNNQQIKVIQQNNSPLVDIEKEHKESFKDSKMDGRKTSNHTKQLTSTPTNHTQVNVCRNCSSTLNDDPQVINSVEQTEKQQSGTIRLLAGKFKRINKRNSKVPDVEYWTETPREQIVVKEGLEMGESKMVVEPMDAAKKDEGVIGKKKVGSIRRSLSWRLKKDKQFKSETSEEPSLPKIKEKGNKFSSIRSMFEPLSPVPNIRRRSTKSNSTKANKVERVVSLRYSKNEEEEGRPISPPSSPEANMRLDGSPGSQCSTFSSSNVSSDVYSSDSSAIEELSSYNNASMNVRESSNSHDEEKIIVDVPIHLIPPELSRSPSSPRTILSPTNTTKSFTSPIASPNARIKLSSLEIRKQAGHFTSPETSKKEINNNHLDNSEKASIDRSPPVLQSVPIVRPKPIKSASIAVVKPKQVSNIAMVSPIMKSDVIKQQQSYIPVDDSLSIRRTSSSIATVKSIPASRPNVTPGDKVFSNKSHISGKVRQIEVCLLLEQDQKIKDAFKIGTIPVQQVNTYKDIEDSVVESFNKHLELLDKQLLDINQNDIAYLQVAQRKISLGSAIDLSRIDTDNGCLSCQMCLKGQNEWSLASLSYETLIPKTYLEKYVSLILTHRQVIFYGPSGTGKSYLARRISSLITHRMNNNKIPTLIYKNISDTQWQGLLETVKSEKRSEPYVILIDGFAAGFIKSEKDITDVITASESIHPQPYIICTLTQSSNYDIPSPWQNTFKWIWLPNHEGPIDSVLERYLRRKYTQHGKIDIQQEGFRIADWLSNTWSHVNGVLERFNSTECTIGPTMFYTCPTDISCTEEWFVDLWNYSITPYLLHAIKCGIKLYGQRHDWVDPLEWVLKTYPWNNSTMMESDRKSKLRRIRPEDVGYLSSVSNTQPQVDSEAEKERLMDFLRQLELLMHDGGLGEIPSFERTTQYESAI